MEGNRDSAFAELVIKQIVDHPEDVKVTRTVDQLGVLLSVDLHKEDMGTIIGRAGSTVKAIRTLLRVIGAKEGARVNLKINEPEGSTFRHVERQVRPNPLAEIREERG